jgi:hypothetical protein
MTEAVKYIFFLLAICLVVSIGITLFGLGMLYLGDFCRKRGFNPWGLFG